MKTADELFEKYSNCIDYLNNDGSKEENQNILFDLGFHFALAEHDKEIISLIDEMNCVVSANRATVDAVLTELKKKLGEIK